MNRWPALTRLFLFPFLLAIGIALVLILSAGTADAGRAQVKATICEVFGPRCGPAIRVAHCETGGTFNPRAWGRAGERGLFQIHPVHFNWLDESRLWLPGYNSQVAYRLSRGGRDWSAWSCRP